MTGVNHAFDQASIVSSFVASKLTLATIHHRWDGCIYTCSFAIAASIFAHLASEAIAIIVDSAVVVAFAAIPGTFIIAGGGII